MLMSSLFSAEGVYRCDDILGLLSRWRPWLSSLISRILLSPCVERVEADAVLSATEGAIMEKRLEVRLEAASLATIVVADVRVDIMCAACLNCVFVRG